MPKTAPTTRTDAARNPLKDGNASATGSRRAADDDTDSVNIRRKGVDTVTGIDELDDETPARYRPGADHPSHRAAEVADIAGSPEHRHDLRALTRNAVAQPPKRAKPRKPTARRKTAARTSASKRAGTPAAKKRAPRAKTTRKPPTKRRAR